MPDEFYRLLAKEMPFALAYHQMVWDDCNLPRDYIFLEVNPAFEKMTGLDRDDILGQAVTRVLPGIESYGFDWIGAYGQVAASGETFSFEQYAPDLDCWYEGTAFSFEPGFFAVIFRDITREKLERETLENDVAGAFSLVENSPDMIVRFNAELQHIYCNRAVVTQLGVPARAFLGKTFLDLEGPAERLESMHGILQKTLETGREQQTEEKFCLDGVWKYLHTRIVPERDESGQVVSLLAVTRDVSPLRRLEQEARAKEERLDMLLSKTPAIVYSYQILGEETPRITYVNDNLKNLLGYAPEFFIGNFENWKNLVHPDDWEKLRLRPREGKVGAESLLEYRFRDIRGNYRWLFDCQRIAASRDGFVEVVGTMWDVTERRAAEDKLRQALGQQEILLNNTDVLIWYLKDARTTGAVNEALARFFGQPRAELEQRDLYHLMSPEEARVSVRTNERVISEKAAVRTEEWVRNGQGQERLLSITRTPCMSPENRVEYVVCSAVDVTREKELQRELEAREEKLAAIFNATHHIAFIITSVDPLHPRILEFSPGAEVIFGYRKEEILGRSVSLLHREEDASRFPEMIDRLGREQQGQSREMQLVRKSGEEFPAFFTLYPLLDASGNMWATLGVSLDITEQKQSETELGWKEEQLRGILESQQDIIVRVGLDNRFTYVNDAYCRMFGQTREALLGRSFAPLVHPEDLEATLAAMAKLDRPPYRIYVEQRALTVNGWRWIAWEDSGILNQQGELVEIQGVGRDITESKTAQEELKASEERYRAVVEDQLELICRFRPDGVLTFVNPAYCRYFHKEPDELLGQSFLPLIPEEDQAIVAEQQALLSPDNPVVVYEHRVVLPGEQIRWQQWSDRALCDSRGNVVEYQAVGRDITAQKLAEQELERARAELEIAVDERTEELRRANEQLVEEIAKQQETEAALAEEKRLLDVTLSSIGDGVITTDMQGIVSYSNERAREITGYAMAEAVGRPLSAIVRIPVGENEQRFHARPLEALRTGNEHNGIAEHVLWSRDQTRKIISSRTALIQDAGGQGWGYVIALRDITRQKAAEEQAVLSQKLESLGQMAAGIAHEMNTPMQYIADNAQFLREAFGEIQEMLQAQERGSGEVPGEGRHHDRGQVEQPDEKTASEALLSEVPSAIDDLVEGVERVSHLIRGMRRYAHPGGELKAAADINQVVEQAIDISKNEWKYHSVVHRELQPSLPRVPCHVNQVCQAILNIVLNAADAVDEAMAQGLVPRGIIVVKTGVRDRMAQVSIADNGVGMPEETAERVFEPFFTTKEPGQGTGQGLAIAYEIICNQHGGSLQVESREGKGTVFTILLPLENAD